MLVHVHVLVNAQYHYSCVYRKSHSCRISHMCLLECNVYGEITAVVLSRCKTSTPLFVDLSGPSWRPSHRLYSLILRGFYLCVLAT